MVGTANMNIVLGQGNAVKEVQNVRRQSLEMSQQFTAQHSEEKKKEEKSKVDIFETRNKIELRDDEQQKQKKYLKKKKARTKDQMENESTSPEGKLLDITV